MKKLFANVGFVLLLSCIFLVPVYAVYGLSPGLKSAPRGDGSPTELQQQARPSGQAGKFTTSPVQTAPPSYITGAIIGEVVKHYAAVKTPKDYEAGFCDAYHLITPPYTQFGNFINISRGPKDKPIELNCGDAKK